MFRFVLDPIAEMLAAVSWARECGTDVERWRELFDSSRDSEDPSAGFVSALRLVHETYWQEQRWPRPQELQLNGGGQEASSDSDENEIQSTSA